MRQRFGIRRVVFVGDRGMITSRCIDEELRGLEGVGWITALRADRIRHLASQGILQPSLFDERDLAEITSPDYPGERFVVCRNPLLAAERTRKREELLQATEKKLNRIAAATTRPHKPLQGKEHIALRVGAVLNAYKVGKHFILEIEAGMEAVEWGTGKTYTQPKILTLAVPPADCLVLEIRRSDESKTLFDR